jgi:hypothetical protein
VSGSLADVVSRLPQFGRQPFTMTSVNGTEIGANPYLDMVYRVPAYQGDSPIPVGVVSKNYRLVDHRHVLRTIEEVLLDCGIRLSDVKVRGEWTVQGERARFSLLFPTGDPFGIALGGNDELRFRIEVFNSVEGSCRLMLVAGWLRFVCSNGLILGRALINSRQQHRQQLDVDELSRLLRESMDTVEEDKALVACWQSTPIHAGMLDAWADDDVCEAWGMKAAVRVLAISKTGADAEPRGDLRGKRPSEVTTTSTAVVPGITSPVDDAFGASQALTWVAGQRSDLQEELEWRSQVQTLMAALLARKSMGGLFLGK